ncbi:hypothetical protein DRE_04154 [Drechslerella stenobrocha 248]|uniref:Uncharacterized protein n=1 Tax=Drechslerella stenobrocha 248 TaxID=1043628 RepID=W7I2M9_9PEZI|nr:hypothetical protein DRE_04154 [Drechslerella stenobrocha 248]
MTDENRPPTVAVVGREVMATPFIIAPSNPLKETITPVYTSMAEQDKGSIRTQVLRGTDAITGLARHEFKRDGKFGDPLPNPIGETVPPLAAVPANIRSSELDTNICKTEWVKSTVDWPFSHLFDRFRAGFCAVKYSEPDEALMKTAKGINYAEDVMITQFQWECRAYADGVRLGQRYVAERQKPEEEVITEEFDYEQYSRGPHANYPMGGAEAFINRQEAQERGNSKREQCLAGVKNVATGKGCNII